MEILKRVGFFKILVQSMVIILSFSYCGTNNNKMTNKTIDQVLKENTDQLMALPGVVGTAHGLCGKKPCIKVYVAQMTDELKSKLPSNLEGYKVDPQVTGGFKALSKDKN